MKTSYEIAEELFGELTPEGWHTGQSHAISSERFAALVDALAQARLDGRSIEREHEAGLRHLLVGHLEAVKEEREFVSATIARAKAAFDEMEARLTVKLDEMTRVIMDAVQASTGARNS